MQLATRLYAISCEFDGMLLLEHGKPRSLASAALFLNTVNTWQTQLWRVR